MMPPTTVGTAPMDQHNNWRALRSPDTVLDPRTVDSDPSKLPGVTQSFSEPMRY